MAQPAMVARSTDRNPPTRFTRRILWYLACEGDDNRRVGSQTLPTNERHKPRRKVDIAIEGGASRAQQGGHSKPGLGLTHVAVDGAGYSDGYCRMLSILTRHAGRLASDRVWLMPMLLEGA